MRRRNIIKGSSWCRGGLRTRMVKPRALAVSTAMVVLLLGFNLIKNSYLLGESMARSGLRPPMAEGLRKEGPPPRHKQDTETAATHTPRPPLASLVNGDNVTGHVDFLLDFAIIGHAKTASSLFQGWLRSHPSIHMDRWEWHALTAHQPAEMVRWLYTNLSDSGLRGYKAPRDIVDPGVLDLLAEYWPSTKLIVGLRHPVTWFQSFYNFKAKRYNDTPNALQLIGE